MIFTAVFLSFIKIVNEYFYFSDGPISEDRIAIKYFMRRLYEGEKILDAQDIKEMSRQDSRFKKAYKDAVWFAYSFSTFRKWLGSFRNQNEDDLLSFVKQNADGKENLKEYN